MAEFKVLEEIYKGKFGDTGLKRGGFRAPGSVNLFGNYLNYNQGSVLSIAIQKSIYMYAQLRTDRKIKVYSIDLNQEVDFDLDHYGQNRKYRWVNYIMGVIKEFQNSNYILQGMNIVFRGDIPCKAGLGSSAALCVASALAIITLNEIDIPLVKMAFLCQRAENNFVGVTSQLISYYSTCLNEKDHTMLIDCRSGDHQLIPFNTDYKIVLCNTGINSKLHYFKFKKRRWECKEALAYFRNILGRDLKSLCDIDIEDYNRYEDILKDTVKRRVKYIVTENNRVFQAVNALDSCNLDTFGRLMVESNNSMRYNFQVSCPEVNLLVTMALKHSGVLASKLTGIGWGGCTINLVQQEMINDFRSKIEENYYNQFGLKPDIHIIRPSEGAEIILDY